jgi:hypothetical protein
MPLPSSDPNNKSSKHHHHWRLFFPVMFVPRVTVGPWSVVCCPRSRILRRGLGQEARTAELRQATETARPRNTRNEQASMRRHT